MVRGGGRVRRCIHEQEFPTEAACRAAVNFLCTTTDRGTWRSAVITKVERTIGEPIRFDDPVYSEHIDRLMQTQTKGTPEHPVVAVDFEQVQFPDVLPTLDPASGRVRVPVRFVSEKLGATVTWASATGTVTRVREGLTITLQVGVNTATVNDRTLTLDAPPTLVPPGRVLVPLRMATKP